MGAPTFVSEAETAYDSATDPKTTSSFSVLAGDILVAYANNGDQGDGDVSVSGGSLTWTQQVAVSVSNFCELWMWTAVVDTNKSMTVTFDRAGSTGSFGGGVQVFRGSNGVGAANSTTGSGAPSLALTTTQANSVIVVANADWNATDGTSRTWRTVNGITPTAGNGLERSYVMVGGGFAEYAAYYSDAGTAASKTVGLSAPTGQAYAIGAVEVKGSAGSTFNDSLSESGSASDSVAAALVAARSVSESGSATDTVSPAGSTFGVSITEAGTATDGVSAILVAVATVSESGSASDSLSSGSIYTPTLAETGSAADSVSSQLIAVAIVTEAASGADVVSSIATRVASLTEAGAAADQIDGSNGGSTYNLTVIEAGSATDQVSAALVSARALLESGNASDAVSSVLAALTQLAEAGAAADAVANVWTGLATLAEVAAAIDSLSTDGQLFPGKRIVVLRAQVAVEMRAQSRVVGASANSVKLN